MQKNIIKLGLPGNYVNQKLVKHGKVNNNLAFEVLQNNGPYLDSNIYNIAFVEYDLINNAASHRPELGFQGSLAEVNFHILHIEQIIKTGYIQ